MRILSGCGLTSSNFTLSVAGSSSHAFDINNNIYSSLKKDALAYFYHNRSGIAIQMPYAGQNQWTRPASHSPDIASCWPGTGCSYSLDVTGGWYDAGDHGKYVVTGGSVTFGITADGNASTSKPASFTLNGKVCGS